MTHTPCPTSKPELGLIHGSGTVAKVEPCGCEVSGWGLLPDPWHIHYCPLHAAAEDLQAACKSAYAHIGNGALASAQDALLAAIAKAEKG